MFANGTPKLRHSAPFTTALILVLVLAACSSDSTDTNADEITLETTKAGVDEGEATDSGPAGTEDEVEPDVDETEAVAGEECEETIRAGFSTPKSGAAAGWGIGTEYAANQAAEQLNGAGGVAADDTRYCFEIASYDNEYDAATGAQVAQTLLNRDNVDFIGSSVGTAPMQALQAQTEQLGMVHFTTAWGPDVKGPDFPFTFTSINTPFELLEPLYSYVTAEHPNAASVHMINPNDATGQQTEKVANEVWDELGIEVVGSEFYERGTTEFAGIATRIIEEDADILDMGTMPPGEAGLLMRDLVNQGWDGVRVVSAGTGGADLVEAGGETVEGTYMGLAANFESDQATDIQRELARGLRESQGEVLNTISIGGYDAMMAYAAALEHAGTKDPDAVRKALTQVEVQSSYGPAVFGAESIYGSPQQLLLPVIVTQVQDGETVELETLVPAELEDRLAELDG